MVTRSVIDVIMGEAGGKTAAERYADMVAIASVIQNRAAQTGKTPDSIISAKDQFDAYGKALPPGVDSMRGLAQAAWDFVQEQGPTHGATFFATPKATKGLPKGLKAETDTASHKYYSDPKGRSIRTAEGFVQPVKSDTQQVASPELQGPQNPYADLVPERNVTTTPIDPTALPGTAPIPTARPDVVAGRTITPGIGLENLVANSRGTPVSAYDTSALAPSTQGLVDALGRSGFGQVGVNSGYRSPARNARAGGASRSQHMSGRAIDLATAQMPESQRAALLEAGIVKGNAKGIGLYPSGNIHMDTRKSPAVWGPGRNAYSGVGIDQVPEYAQPIISDLINAGPYGVTPRTSPPTPTARPDRDPATQSRIDAYQDYGASRAASRTPSEQATIDAYSDYGRSRMAPEARSARTDAQASAGLGAGARGAGTLSIPGVDPVTVQANPTSAPRSQGIAPSVNPTATPAPPMAGVPINVPETPQTGFPEAPMEPGRQARRTAGRGALLGGITGGLPGAVLGGLLGPARDQIRGNIRSNRVGMGRVPIFSGVRNAYRGLLGNTFGGGSLFGGLTSQPNYSAPAYSIGSGYGAIGGSFGAPAGATAYSRSNPSISFTSLGNGLVSRTNKDTGVTYTMSAGDYNAGNNRSGKSRSGRK